MVWSTLLNSRSKNDQYLLFYFEKKKKTKLKEIYAFKFSWKFILVFSILIWMMTSWILISKKYFDNFYLKINL